ncbi:hypothetical protein SADUNF_Sadunf05G0062200 [Salix dunnii]|uniref:Uncharacterized protein n=1 Tax=Salix dunnii TaxID=1413687 RepID=A0A835K2R9_9ROSI|nr:hypothetical protein SADUNF_Sadunf05G0062200 [Salix dunnii]
MTYTYELESTAGMPSCLLVRGIAAPGKFDALDVGHQELAFQASKVGDPYLLSFEGMAERVRLLWKEEQLLISEIGFVFGSLQTIDDFIFPDVIGVEFFLHRFRTVAIWFFEFSDARHLTPQQFLEKLSVELGVVAGGNYRFGHKAAGNASEVVRLCEEQGVHAAAGLHYKFSSWTRIKITEA